MNFDSADECEHLKKLPDLEEYEIILGMRKVVQTFQFCCGLNYNPLQECPVPARLCKAKIEYDINSTDLGTVGLIEIGTRDLNVIFDDDTGKDGFEEGYGSDDDISDDDFGGPVFA